MGKEIEMADALSEGAIAVDDKGKDASSIKVVSVQERLAANVQLIEKAVKQKETRTLFSKLIRMTQALRKELNAHDVQVFVRSTLPTSLASSTAIIESLQQVRSPQISHITVNSCRFLKLLTDISYSYFFPL